MLMTIDQAITKLQALIDSYCPTCKALRERSQRGWVCLECDQTEVIEDTKLVEALNG